MNKLVTPLDDLMAVSKKKPCYCDGPMHRTTETNGADNVQ